MQLLTQVAAKVRAEGWQIVNVDAVIMAERPKMAPHIAAMSAKFGGRPWV